MMLVLAFSNHSRFKEQVSTLISGIFTHLVPKRFIATPGLHSFKAAYSTKSKMPYYAVARGKSTGVYNDWKSCEANVKGVSNSRYMKFATREEASNFVSTQGGGNSGAASNVLGYSSNSYGSVLSALLSRVPSAQLNRVLKNTLSYNHSGSRSSYGGVLKNKYVGYANLSLVGHPLKPAAAKTTEIYVDGASRGNSGSSLNPSGYGVYYGPDDSRNRAVAMSDVDNVTVNRPTNQRAELSAIKHALGDIKSFQSSGKKDSYTIVSDSQYAIKSVTEWSKNWQKNGWKNSLNQPVANRDLVEDCTKLLNDVKDSVSFRHVKGHNGDPGNEAADRLANAGADKMSRR